LQFVLIYLMKVIGSIPKMEPVWELLLTDCHPRLRMDPP
jgi:hypothetical protein